MSSRLLNMKIQFRRFLLMPLLFISFGCFSQECDSCDYWIPNALTPDCDNSQNSPCEVLEIATSCPFTKFDFTIFNKWGEVIFHSTNPKMRFDSTGNLDDTYIWKLVGEYCNSKPIEDTGNIIILR